MCSSNDFNFWCRWFGNSSLCAVCQMCIVCWPPSCDSVCVLQNPKQVKAFSRTLSKKPAVKIDNASWALSSAHGHARFAAVCRQQNKNKRAGRALALSWSCSLRRQRRVQAAWGEAVALRPGCLRRRLRVRGSQHKGRLLLCVMTPVLYDSKS